MTPALIGRKVGMTRIYDEKGAVVPVTVVEAGPCAVTQVKTVETDGYNAVQLGFGDVKAKFSNFPLIGHAAKAGVGPKKHFAEIRFKEATDKKPGDAVTVDLFTDVKYVDVIGVSKGKGFAGVMKRHGAHGQGASHGNEQKHRAPGAIGACATPSRVFKGMPMAGHMGNERISVLNLEVVRADPERGLLLVRGAVPGPEGGLVMIRSAVKAPAAARGV